MNNNIEKRHHCVSSWMNKAELNDLDSRIGDMRRGTYVRHALLRKPPVVVPEVNRQVYAELARSASNLNQIALRLNMREHVEMTEVLTALRDFRIKLITA